MSTLTLAVADYFKQEPQLAALDIQQQKGPVVGIPIKNKKNDQNFFLLSSPRDLLSTSAPPAASKSVPWVSPSLPRNINMSWTTTSFLTLAPDLTLWKPRRDVGVDPLTPLVVVSEANDKVEAVQGFSKILKKKERSAPRVDRISLESKKSDATVLAKPIEAVAEASKAPKPFEAQQTINIEKKAPEAPKTAPVSTDSTPEKPRAASDTMPPLRKLKLSLKLPQLQKSKLALHLLPKLVRFASTLEKVKMFDGRDSPSAVSTQNTPLGSPSTFDFDVDDYFSNNSNFTDLALGSDDSDSDLDSFFGPTPQHRYKISSTNYTSPQNVYDKQSCPVYLQQIGITSDKKLLSLTVMCENLAFEKHLSIKMTFNNWCSTVIYNNAQYVKLFTLINFDQFKFTIPLIHLPSAINLQFCIKYAVAGHTFWDNHDTKNYSVTLTTCSKPKPKPKPKPRRSNFSSSFNFEPPTYAAKPAAQPAAKPEVTKKPVSYNELVSKLMNVKVDEQRPHRAPLFKSWLATNVSSPPARPATQPRPRYSQSYKARTATHPLTTETHLSDGSPTPTKELSPEEITTPRSVGAFHETQFNSNTYAALLRTYCFSGTPSANNSLSSSPSHSISSSPAEPTYDCASPASTFHTFSDSIHI